jgi:ParB family transcriptional regulator, chromosome partitioning protein
MRIRERLRGSHTDDGAEKGENLIRFPLTAAQEAAAIFRRKAIYQALHPETKHGANQHTKVGDCNLQTPCFVEATARVTGKDASTISRANSRGEALGDDAKAIVGTSLDKGVELDALAERETAPVKGPYKA